jgi:phosphatidylglycerophosphate synthase
VSPYSRHLARWAAERGLTPNQVTVASLLVGVVAAVAFGVGDRAGLVVGALLLQASFALDCVDGELARYARIFSALGGWLDASFDRLKEYAVYAGLAIGGARSGDDVWLLAACALALQVVRHAVDFGFATRHADRAAAPPLPFDRPSDATGARGPSTGGVARLSAATTRTRALMYAKRTVILPIGERWALISLCAAVAGPRVAFVALLAWGGLAAAYMLTGRVLRSVPDA